VPRPPLLHLLVLSFLLDLVSRFSDAVDEPWDLDDPLLSAD
jgi:hypothetical protein